MEIKLDKIKKRNSITFEVLRYISIYYFTFAFVLTALQIVYEYYNIKTGIEDYVSDIQDNFTDSLTNSLWEFNEIQTDSLLKGIVKSPMITKVDIFLPNGERLYSVNDNVRRTRFSRFASKDKFQYETPLVKIQKNGVKEHIGKFVIYSDDTVILNQLSRLIQYIITNSIIKTLFLWIVLVIVFNKKLRKPLLSFVQNLSSIDPSSPKRLEFESSEDVNEFYEIKASFNYLIQKLNNYKDVLEAIVENKTTLLKEKNVEVEDLIGNLEKAQQRIIQQERLSALGLLTAGIAHELKNPLNLSLNTGIMLKELIEELEIDKVQKESLLQSLDIVINNNQKMSSISQTMLMQSRSYKDPKQEIDLKPFIENNFNVLRSSYPDLIKEIKFEINCPEPYKVNVFVNDFGRLLINLLENSLHAICSKIEKTSFNPLIQITIEDLNKSFRLVVFDNGIGMDSETVEKIFTPFYTTKKAGKGTGLGLYLNMEIIKKHNGEMKVDSIENESTTFIIKLPKQ